MRRWIMRYITIMTGSENRFLVLNALEAINILSLYPIWDSDEVIAYLYHSPQRDFSNFVSEVLSYVVPYVSPKLSGHTGAVGIGFPLKFDSHSLH